MKSLKWNSFPLLLTSQHLSQPLAGAAVTAPKESISGLPAAFSQEGALCQRVLQRHLLTHRGNSSLCPGKNRLHQAVSWWKADKALRMEQNEGNSKESDANMLLVTKGIRDQSNNTQEKQPVTVKGWHPVYFFKMGTPQCSGRTYPLHTKGPQIYPHPCYRVADFQGRLCF